jgi:hypothetical protein
MVDLNLKSSRKIVKVRGLPVRPAFARVSHNLQVTEQPAEAPLGHEFASPYFIIETFEDQDWDQIVVPSIDFSTPTDSFGPETFEGQDWDQIIVPAIDFDTPTASFGPEAFEAGAGWDKLEEPAEPFDFTTASGFIENFSGW